jgi:hypothetical protein
MVKQKHAEDLLAWLEHNHAGFEHSVVIENRPGT